MSHNRTGMILVDKWRCYNCSTVNDPETEICWECGADMDGEVPKEEEFEGVEE